MDIWKLSFEEQIEFLQHKLRHKEELEKLYVKQEKEIERLREALRHYACNCQNTFDCLEEQCGGIALSALQQNEAQILATNTYEAEGRN